MAKPTGKGTIVHELKASSLKFKLTQSLH